ncbi:hypothetical protein Hte_006899 [Hypoxylon texense]
MAAVNPDSQELPIWVGFKGNNRPFIFDLSGAVPFEVYLTVRRSVEDEAYDRDLVLMKAGSVFDFPAALGGGLVELVDETSGEVVRPHSSTDQAQTQQAITLGPESFITLPTDVRRRDRAIKAVSLHAAPCLRALVLTERKYHLRLRDKNLGVHWWAWGSPPESCKNGNELPPPEPKTLVSFGPLRSKAFTVVSEIPIPPKLSIGLSLGEEEAYALGGNDSAELGALLSPVVRITITNTSSRPITLKTIGDQPHLTAPGEITNPRARVTADRPDVQNFSIIDQETQQDLMSHAPLFTTPLAGGSGRGWPRKQFLALAPHERVVRTAKLPGHRLVPGREYRVSLRRTGCWWAYGTLDDLFGEDNAILKRWPSAPTVPMPLESEDVVWSASRLPFVYALLRGTIVHDIEKLHRKYGPILRIAPNEVTFAQPEAWADIFQLRPGHQQFLKDPVWWKRQPGHPESLISAIEVEPHARIRKALAPGFTPRALRGQEPILQRYVNLLVERLSEVVTKSQGTQGVEIDIGPWFNFVTFDIFGDLGFGESFDCLQNSRYHPWIALLFNSVKAASFVAAARFYPWVEFLLMKCIPPSLRKMQQAHYQQIVDKVQRRLNYEQERPDIMSYVAVGDEVNGLSIDETNVTFMVLTTAGSETTATVLGGTLNYLVNHRDKLDILTQEIRNQFQRTEDMTLDALRNLPYLNATISEGLRLCPPIPWVLPRQVPPGGDEVCGKWLPGGTPVSIQAYTMNRDPSLFHDPTSFFPERWLPEASTDAKSPFFHDQRQAIQSFSAGPRSCMGQHLAWAEMRLTLSKLLWSLDFEAVEGKILKWEDLRTFLLVEKKPIQVRMKIRRVLEEAREAKSAATHPLGAQWSQVFPPKPHFTEADVPSQDGKVFLITGGASGIGFELAKMLYGKNARVYIAGRSQAKAEQAIKDIQAAVLHFLHLELDDLSSIEATVDAFKAKETELHILWNNAGVSRPPLDSVSKQGIELQLATNCLGPFLLTQLLLPLLQAAAAEAAAAPGSVRVVWTASQAVELSAPEGGLAMSELRDPPRDSSRLYTNSKTGNWLLAAELARRTGSSATGAGAGGVVSVALNPGAASSNLFRHTPSVNYLAWPLLHEPRKAALTELYAGLSEDIGPERNGCYVIPFGRISTNMRQDLVDATKPVEEGGSGRAGEFWGFCVEKTQQYRGSGQ